MKIRGGLVVVSAFLFFSVYSESTRGSTPPMIATEEEVRQFFSDYVRRYNEKDLSGFLSMFSSKAIQNKRERIGDIEKAYGDFFRNSEQIRYRLDRARTEIYQNAVEVDALYELIQKLKRGGKERSFKGKARWVLVKEDGVLRILSLDYEQLKSPQE